MQVGNLRVYLLPFEHIGGAENVPQALAAYGQIADHDPGVPVIFEYFDREIDYEQLRNPLPISPNQDELNDIRNSYGQFADAARLTRVLMLDPAFNYRFGIQTLAIGGGALVAARTAFIRLLNRSNMPAAPNDSEKTAQPAPPAHTRTRRGFMRDVAVGVVGLMTALNEAQEGLTGLPQSAGYNPPDLPLALLSSTEFRMLTVVHGLQQLSDDAATSGIDAVTLVYPPSHIRRIKDIVQAGGVQQALATAKFAAYRALFSSLNIMAIRDWQRPDAASPWQLIDEKAITLSI